MALILEARKPAGYESTWTPGAFTSARCDAWQKLDWEGRKRLGEWIATEKLAMANHETELPDWAK